MSENQVGWYNSPHEVSHILYWDGNLFSTYMKFGYEDVKRHLNGKGLDLKEIIGVLAAGVVVLWWLIPSFSYAVVLLIGIALGAGNMYGLAIGCRDEHSEMGYPEEQAP